MMQMVRESSKLIHVNSELSLLTRNNYLYVLAKRIAMYQEMDSEEEECMSHGGTLPRRDSVTSHQSARVVLRSQSTKSHRRTGSRAEAKRASILSKHTAFSSPMVSTRHLRLAVPVLCSTLPLSCRRRTSPPTRSSWTNSTTAAVRWNSCATTASPCPSCPPTWPTSLISSSL